MIIKSKDLAKMLGVSTATISLVINNKPGISSSLRKKIVNQMIEMGYGEMLNTEEQNQRGEPRDLKKRNIVYAVYADDEEDEDSASFFPAVLEGAEMQASEDGYNIQVVHIGSDSCRLKDRITPSECAGIIVQAKAVSDSVYKDLENTGLPYVFLDYYDRKKGISAVCVNNEDGIYSAVEYLKNLGHRNIGYIAGSSGTFSCTERRRYFVQALWEQGLEINPEFVMTADGYYQNASESLVKQWGKMNRLPTAFIAENDILAAQTMKALRKFGLRVPGEISVVGFDDRPVAKMTDPSTTTVRVHRHIMGRQSVVQLMNLIDMTEKGFGCPSYRMNVGVRLMERESTAAPSSEIIELC